MESLFDELKRAREERGIPLAQISDITRISEEYLLALERGDVKMLPQAYVRAFLREYAEVVGLSPEEVMRKYNAAAGEAAGHPTPPPPSVSAAPLEARSTQHRSYWNATTARIALIIAAVVVLVVIAWNLAGRKGEPVTEEIPFQNVIRQEEERLAPASPHATSPADSSRPAAPGDSLLLRASTTDSVWVMIVRDDLPPLEYLFPPNSHASWKARDRFLVTLGSAAAIQFTLNQKAIGVLGKAGAVIRNYEISRKMLSRP
jgi:cytoskeletal protein RodZ